MEALSDLGLTPGFYAGFAVVMDVVFALVWVTVAVLVFAVEPWKIVALSLEIDEPLNAEE